MRLQYFSEVCSYFCRCNTVVKYLFLIFSIILSWRIHAETPLAAAGQNLNISYMRLVTATERMRKLPCAGDSALENLNIFSPGAFNHANGIQNNITKFYTIVKKTIDGTGKCDGSFQIIAKEMELRAVAAENLKKYLEIANSSFSALEENNFTAPILFFDGNADPNCATQAINLTDEINDLIAEVKKNNLIAAQSALGEANRLREFSRMNFQMAKNCGRGVEIKENENNLLVKDSSISEEISGKNRNKSEISDESNLGYTSSTRSPTSITDKNILSNNSRTRVQSDISLNGSLKTNQVEPGFKKSPPSISNAKNVGNAEAKSQFQGFFQSAINTSGDGEVSEKEADGNLKGSLPLENSNELAFRNGHAIAENNAREDSAFDGQSAQTSKNNSDTLESDLFIRVSLKIRQVLQKP